jgi:hypothetical protein
VIKTIDHCPRKVENHESDEWKPAMPRASTFVVLLESLLRIRELRADHGAGLDQFYLGNLGAGDVALNDRQLDADVVPEVITKVVHELREYLHPRLPIFVGRNQYVALRDEVIPDLMALNRGSPTGAQSPFGRSSPTNSSRRLPRLISGRGQDTK